MEKATVGFQSEKSAAIESQTASLDVELPDLPVYVEQAGTIALIRVGRECCFDERDAFPQRKELSDIPGLGEA